ncbi:TorD/DmsD family molecular chaperone [Sulfuricystis multivorans]|uniref:TorD/DmsD family molecular chaperone n=1 Tax=Sulfuricystis multivorans TaxID=2211108 RepID=UPI000F832C6F|nr:molecular chaperone TorD family protein [Sulfuricystis multivorans]
MNDLVDLGDWAEKRSQIYWLFARFFLVPPDAEFIAALSGVSLAVGDDDMDPIDGAAAQLQRCLGTASLQDLQVEHLRLFGGVREGYGPPPPYESIHREGRLLGESTESVLRHYCKHGFFLEGEHGGRGDHLGLELKFLALLCHEESRRWRDGNISLGLAALAAQWAFIVEHLHAWAPNYCRRIQGETVQAFFQAAMALTAAMIEQDALRLPALLNELSTTNEVEVMEGELQ